MGFQLDVFSKANILIIGDIMLDQYIWGEVERISPEAPVPVVRVLEKTDVIGGAGNVASNLAGLECSVTLVGVCGEDEKGKRLEDLLREKKINSFLLRDETRPTIVKSRVMASKQQLFRLDEEDAHVLSHKLEEQLFSWLGANLAEFQAVILSDYGKGLLQSPGLCQKIIALCKKKKIICLVDPKGIDWERYTGATCITPNTAELGLLKGLSIKQLEANIDTCLEKVRKQYDLEYLLLTQGPKGMSFTDNKGQITRIPTRAREVFDVSGAGDTVIASLACGLSSGLIFSKAAELANIAAGFVVGKLGTQHITRSDLATAIQLLETESQITKQFKTMNIAAARIQVQAWRTSGVKVVFTNGCFDLLHPGHIDLLHRARALGDRLIIGLNTDASIKRLKGDHRPILTEKDRALILGALGCVDMVVLFDEDNPLNLIKEIRPEILVKGRDYKIDEVVGRDLVESYGGKVILVPILEGYSTTQITEKVIASNISE